MTTQETIQFVRLNLNKSANIQTLWRWKKGYYIHPKTKQKVWYCQDHSCLPCKNKGRFKGFDFNQADVVLWVSKMEAGLPIYDGR